MEEEKNKQRISEEIEHSDGSRRSNMYCEKSAGIEVT